MNPAPVSASSASAASSRAPGTTTASPNATPASWFSLGVLILIALYAVLDRQVFVLLAEPIRVQFALSDFQLGLLQGLGVSLFAALAGLPIGWLADRHDRRRVLAGCVLVWSLAVVACALAQNFTQLMVASALVGAGEAGLMPIVFALIPELFRNQQRQLANSLNIVGTRLGVGLVIALCGYLTLWVEAARPHLPAVLQGLETWRLTFIAAALPAPLFVLLLLWLPVPGRRAGAVRLATDAGTTTPSPPAGPPIGAYLRTHRAGVGGVLVGLAIATFGLAAAGVWLPVVAMRQFGATPVQVGNALGTATFVATLIGLVFTTWGLRRLAPRFGVRLPVVAMAAGCLLAGIAGLALPLATSANSLFALYGVLMTALMIGLMAYPTALQDVAPAALRSRIFALSGLVGLAAGAAAPPFVGALSDSLAPRTDGLLLVTAGTAALSLLLAAAVFVWTAKYHAAVVKAAADAS